MPDLYELPMIETEEVIANIDPKTGKLVLEIFTVRYPDLAGAECNWGQQEDNGATMVIVAEGDPAEIAKLGGFKKN